MSDEARDEPTIYRLGEWSTTDLAEARMRARGDAVALLGESETFLGETPEQAVRGPWDTLKLHYSVDYLRLVVNELEKQVAQRP